MSDERREAWNRYREAAVSGARPRVEADAATTLVEQLRLRAAQWWSVDPVAGHTRSGRWRDLRLVPIGAAAWLGAALAPAIGPSATRAGLLASTLAVAAGALAIALAASVVKGRVAARRRGLSAGLKRSVPAAVLTACTAIALAAGLGAAAGHHAAEHSGPAGELLDRGGQTVATVEVTGEPNQQRQRGTFGSGPRFAAEGRLLQATDGGRSFTASASIRLVGGAEMARVRSGTTIEVAGRIVPADQPGRTALLSVSSRPRVVESDAARRQVGALRESLRRSSEWLWPDAAGLLPGMTVGDTAALPVELEDAMRDVGLGHLTAVSGANFTLLLALVLLGLRSLRASRAMVLIGCALAVIGFTVIVGPEPSVLRAAAMGTVGLVALVSGRAGRSCSAVSSAVLVLVLAQPPLALSMGFLLSVAATLGIALLGPPLTQMLAARFPAWLALAVAVPLSAQLTCGPLMVLIQPSFLSLSLVANVASTPFVPVVTVAGTLALATCAWCPPVALLAVGVGGAGAQAIALTARMLAGLPGATLPWPEGVGGAVAMAAVSGLNAALLWATLLPSGQAAVRLLACRIIRLARAALACTASGLGVTVRRGRVER
ncbi:ComEC/Rec2 family competence protein [Sinomonas sp. ASV486]|uniref:ComEC/Rec2 family competence protein n=1 Tax=Sinomonas sp. ASV486 TaxID=3051170 RepID=UPI0027DC915B|nr:ComEC/Rec2 family competence protein [Sinomonas sp. ASV486]MDQ4491445.1 ComEC/Rec2 family competence protein [Sinomonas sp. ASV486]